MKKIINIVFFVLGITKVCFGQCINENNTATAPCCNGIIATDPTNGNAANGERSSSLNKFNWQDGSWNGYNTSAGSNYSRDNPFYLNDKYLRHINYYNYALTNQATHKIDNKPADGWELITRNFGYEPDEMAIATLGNRKPWPYFVLYNKYTGALRFLGSKPRSGDAQKLLTTLQFKTENQLKLSGLFANYGRYRQTLDSKTSISQVSSTSDLPANGGFFVADFNAMSYDPCICNSNSELKFSFATLTTANIVMSGRLIGTQVPLDGSGNSPLLNRDSFLLAVTNDKDFNVSGGMRTYNNIDALVKKYKTPEISIEEQVLKSLIKAGFEAGDKQVGGLLSSAGTWFIKKVLEDSAALLGSKGKLGNVGIGLLASNANAINSALGFTVEQKVPNIGFIEAEIAMSGTMTALSPDNDGEITLATPGSINSISPAIKWSNYSTYNEALGIVAILNKPEASQSYYKAYDQDIDWNTGQPRVYESTHRYGIKLTKKPEFYFNPILGVDLEKTKVYASYSLKLKNGVVKEELGLNERIGDFNRIEGKKLDFNPQNKSTYMTDFVPLECFNNMKAEIDAGNNQGVVEGDLVNLADTVEVKLLFFVKYKKNKYGKDLSTLIELTLPVNMTNLAPVADPQYVGNYLLPPTIKNFEKIGKYPIYVVLKSANNNLNYSDNTVIQAWNSIVINGTITLAPGKTLTLIAGEDVVISPNASIPPGVIIISGQKPSECTPTGVQPVSDAFIKDFCKNGSYKANQPTFALAKYEPTLKIDSVKVNLLCAPNPFNNLLTINYEVNESTQVTVSLSNALGQVVKVLVNEKVEAGSYQFTESTADLPSGVYIVSMKTPTGLKTQKVVKQNN